MLGFKETYLDVILIYNLSTSEKVKDLKRLLDNTNIKTILITNLSVVCRLDKDKINKEIIELVSVIEELNYNELDVLGAYLNIANRMRLYRLKKTKLKKVN